MSDTERGRVLAIDAQSGDRAAPDREAMARAVREFLLAARVDLEDPEIRDTPQKVAAAWADEFLEGLGQDPYAVLGEGIRSESRGVVTVRDVEFVSVCPHHMLPYRGTAHVAFAPSERIVGFSRVVRLLDSLSRRMLLQEELTGQLAEVLHQGLGAEGVGVVTIAEQSCMTMRGVRQAAARTICRAYKGSFEDDAALKTTVDP